MDFDLGTTTTFLESWVLEMLLPDLCLLYLFHKWIAEHSFLAMCWHVSMFFVHVFPSTPFSTNEKTTTTNDTGDTSLDLSRGYSSRGVLKQQLQTAVESTGSFEMLWSAVGELDMSGSSTGLTKKLRWPNWASLKNCGNYKGRMKEERFYCLCKIVWYLHYVH